MTAVNTNIVHTLPYHKYIKCITRSCYVVSKCKFYGDNISNI